MLETNKYKKYILYILSFIMIVYYFIVLFNSINPNVCREYKMYYITKELVDWPGFNGLNYKLGNKLEFLNNSDNKVKCRGKGWNDIEDFGTWTQDKSYLYLNLNDEINEELELNISIREFVPNAELLININDENIGKIKLQKGIQEYQIIIPSHIVKQQFLKIEFDVDNADFANTFVNNGDTRLLGVYFTSIELTKRGDSNDDK